MNRRSSQRRSSSSSREPLFHNPIVEEVHRIREVHAARFDYDPERIFADLKERERQGGLKLISLPPRPARKVDSKRPSRHRS
jgi:hypothetical protein